MGYSYESQEKALKYLIENAPHDMNKFEKLYNVKSEGENKAEVSLRDILFSDVWTAEEKVQLIKLYKHNDENKYKYRVWNYKTYERDVGYTVGIEGLPLIDECIRQKNYSGVQALLSLGAHISVATIIRIIKYIEDPTERYKFCELLISYYGDKENIKAYVGTGNQCILTEIPTLCDRYPVYINDFLEKKLWKTVSSMEDICATNDVELVKLFLPTVKNIDSLFTFAVKSKNIEMVKLFIEAGANVNFQDLVVESDYNANVLKTPLKIAIDNNDLEMVKYLHQNGADLNFVDKSEKTQEFIDNIGEEFEKETHQYKDYRDRIDYISLTKNPLEYAITLGPASIIGLDLINDVSTGETNNYEKQFKDRMAIVKYLYENGATFDKGQINYTDLICFAIKSDDFDSTRYYFEEALKNRSKLDFEKIISFIHNPGVVQTSDCASICYKQFEEGAKHWFKLCEEYSKKFDNKNYNRNIKLMLEKIFDEFTFNDYLYDKYKTLITDFSKLLPKNMLKDIPAVFGVGINNLEEILSLGYDINTVKNGRNILMDYILDRHFSIEMINKLINLGVDVNYQNPQNGDSALSCVMLKLPQYDFGRFIDNFNPQTKQLYYSPEEYEIGIKTLVKMIIELSNEKIIMSDNVRENVCTYIKPGYPQIIYNEILEALSKKGFKVSDDYVTKSITFLDEPNSLEYVTNPWEYLWNLYSNFANKSIKTNYKFPKIEEVKSFKYGTEQNNKIFTLINEHLKRNFVTTVEQIQEPDKVIYESYYYNSIEQKYENITALRLEQDKILIEISRYIGNLDYRQIMALIDSYSIIDIKSINRNNLLPIALFVEDLNLCRELIKRGATIISYDESGHDITSEKYSAEQIKKFQSLSKEYNPNQEYEDLLAEIGCEDDALSKKLKPFKNR